MNKVFSGFTVTYSDITGLVTITNSNSFLLNFATSTMYVVLGFLPQQYAATIIITAPYALTGRPLKGPSPSLRHHLNSDLDFG